MTREAKLEAALKEAMLDTSGWYFNARAAIAMPATQPAADTRQAIAMPATDPQPVAWRWHWNGGDEPDVWAYSETAKVSDQHITAEPLFAARPAPQPAADTRVVTAFPPNYDGGPLEDGYLKTITAYFKQDEAEHAMAAEVLRLRAIIGTARPAPSDKIADMPETDVGDISNYYGDLAIKAENGVGYWSIENYDGHDWKVCPPDIFAALRALAGKGE